MEGEEGFRGKAVKYSAGLWRRPDVALVSRRVSSALVTQGWPSQLGAASRGVCPSLHVPSFTPHSPAPVTVPLCSMTCSPLRPRCVQGAES